MCTPTAVLIGTSMVMQMQAAGAQGKYETGRASYNARVAENAAQDTITAGVEAENVKRTETAQLLAKQRAQLGASGVDIGSGSALQLQEDTITLGEADALRIRGTAEAKAQALKTQSTLTLAEGAAARTAAKNKQIGSLFKGAAAIAGTGVADKWFKPNSSAMVEGDAFQPAMNFANQ